MFTFSALNYKPRNIQTHIKQLLDECIYTVDAWDLYVFLDFYFGVC
jgi:hypothetical protein